MISFTCACGRVAALPDHSQGKEVRCQRCGLTSRIDVAPVAGLGNSLFAARPHARGRLGRPRLPLAPATVPKLILGISLLVFGGAITWIALSDGGPGRVEPTSAPPRTAPAVAPRVPAKAVTESPPAPAPAPASVVAAVPNLPAPAPVPAPTSSSTVPTYRKTYLNPNSVDETGGDFLYADAVASGRGWADPHTNAPIPLGPDLYPAQDFDNILISGQPVTYAHGLYTIYTTGRALGWTKGRDGKNVPDPADPLGGISFPYSTSTVLSKQYDPRTNTGVVRIVVKPFVGGDNLLRVHALNTRRSPRDRINTGLKIKVMRPIALGSMTSHEPSELFSRPALTLFAGVDGWRNLNPGRVNAWPDNYVLEWGNRRLPTDPLAAGPGTQGMADEHQRLFSNADPRGIKPDFDLWRCIPNVASDDYILQQARADRWGTDGVNSYTGPEGPITAENPRPQPSTGPVYPGVHGKILLQWSNEVDFNWGGAFGSQFAQVSTEAFRYWHPQQPRLTDINWDGSTDNNLIRLRWIGKKTKLVADTYRRVFGDDQFGVKFFPVLMGQQDNPSNIGPALDYLVRAQRGDPAQLNPDRSPTAANKAKVAEVICFLGTATYRDMAPKSLDIREVSPEQVIGAGMDPKCSGVAMMAFARSWGLPGASYEGGLNRGQEAITPQTVAVTKSQAFHRYVAADLDDNFAAGLTIQGWFQSCGPNWAINYCSYNLDEGPYRALVARAAAWRDHPAGAISREPLPPAAVVTGLTIGSIPPLIGGTKVKIPVEVVGTNNPIRSVTCSSGVGTMTNDGTITLPPAASTPQPFAIQIASTIRPEVRATRQLVIPAATGPAAPAVLDSSFELYPGLDPTSVDSRVQNPAGLAWVPDGTAGYVGISTSADLFMRSNPPTPFGAQILVLAQAGKISQTIPGWAAGSYQISLAGCQRGTNNSRQTVRISIDGAVVAEWRPTQTEWAPFTSPPFRVAKGTHVLTLAGLGGLYDNGYFDQVGLVLASPSPRPVGGPASNRPRLAPGR